SNAPRPLPPTSIVSTRTSFSSPALAELQYPTGKPVERAAVRVNAVASSRCFGRLRAQSCIVPLPLLLFRQRIATITCALLQRCAEVDLIFITFSRKAVLSGVVADPTQRHADSEGQRP